MRVFFLLLFSLNAHGGLFTAHVKESIEINKERRPYYHSLTDGKSNKAIDKLIYTERLMLPFARYYDFRSSSHQKNGIGLLKDEFRPMNNAPEFDPHNRKYPEGEIPAMDWERHKMELKAIILKKDRELLLSHSLKLIHEYNEQPEYWCLTRHLVESIYRFAWFLPKRLQEAQDLNVRSPETLIWKMINFHLVGFSLFSEVDLLAATVQKEGIPMICSELPDLMSDLH